MQPTKLIVLLAFIICSCASLKKAQVEKTDTPALGVIGKTDNSLLHRNFQRIGQPVISKPIAIALHRVPFTKSQFKTFSYLKQQRNEKPTVEYVDSLLVKPMYFRLEVEDKIGLKSFLNLPENEQVRSYLAKDDGCKVVTGISFYMHETESALSSNSQNLFLTTDYMGVLHIERINGNKRQVISIPESDIFEYDLMGFCWAEDIYGKPKIELLNEGSCPDGTEKSAKRLDDSDSFLKL